MPKSKELLFLCRNVGTGQRSALLYSLCFSPHLSPSPFFLFFSASLSSFPPSASLSILSLCFNFPPFASSPMLFRLLTHFYLPLFLSHFLVSTCYLDSCIYFLTHLSILHPFPLYALMFVSPSSQCSCRRTRPTRCCDGCAGPTSCWRR